MPTDAKGPRLYFKRGNLDKAGKRLPGFWIIRDGDKRVGTGVRAARRGTPPQAAQDALAEYIIGRRAIPRTRNSDAASVEVADVIRLYMEECAPKHARPIETIARCVRLLEFWGDKRLSDVTGASCRAYAAITTRAGARRELEDLRAAIGHHRSEGLCRELVSIVLPERGQPKDRWLTREEAARLIRAAWRYREVQKGHPTGRKSRQHVARFVLIALYTGTRAGAICGGSFNRVQGSGYIDLERGVFYRKPEGERETKKRKPPAKIPDRLLAHMRRWHRDKPGRAGQVYAVQFNGKPIGTGIEKAFRGACRDAGLEGVTPHVLRHTAATWLMQKGTSIWDAAGFLGMTTETIERVYAHHHPSFQEEAARNIARKA
jgi:integrase